jgi:hypothetical protein
MTPSQPYSRTPLPKDAHAPVLPVALLWMAIIFSPFVAFTVNGRVDDSNWMPALVTAGVAFAFLALLHVRAASNYLALPVAVRAEYRHGKVFPVIRRHQARPDREFELGLKTARIAFAKDGIRVTTAAWLRSDYKRALELARKVWAHGADTNAMRVFVPWSDIQEWEVHTNSDGPDYYRLRCTGGGHVNLRRPAKPADEIELLDSVRSTGQIPVRLFCDVPQL